MLNNAHGSQNYMANQQVQNHIGMYNTLINNSNHE